MGGGSKCLKILVLVTLIPVALRASSLLLGGGHGGAPPATLLPRRSWHVTRRPAGLSVSSAASSAHEAYRHTNQPRRRRTEGDAGWFEDDKRLAPTGANPLHNLRR
ncbi:hypothetical protein QOZ80_1AG0011370 [Eleusine coracana subsp. coracana]|nr:hypothetical protein QOZ80_1AG0011370 [Eleusine coracana subsp. coracana]